MKIKTARYTAQNFYHPKCKSSKYNTRKWSVEHMVNTIKKYMNQTSLAKKFGKEWTDHLFSNRTRSFFIETLMYIEEELQIDLFVTDSPDSTTSIKSSAH